MEENRHRHEQGLGNWGEAINTSRGGQVSSQGCQRGFVQGDEVRIRLAMLHLDAFLILGFAQMTANCMTFATEMTDSVYGWKKLQANAI